MAKQYGKDDRTYQCVGRASPLRPLPSPFALSPSPPPTHTITHGHSSLQPSDLGRPWRVPFCRVHKMHYDRLVRGYVTAIKEHQLAKASATCCLLTHCCASLGVPATGCPWCLTYSHAHTRNAAPSPMPMPLGLTFLSHARIHVNPTTSPMPASFSSKASVTQTKPP
jgi:hypothetical protein